MAPLDSPEKNPTAKNEKNPEVRKLAEELLTIRIPAPIPNFTEAEQLKLTLHHLFQDPIFLRALEKAPANIREFCQELIGKNGMDSNFIPRYNVFRKVFQTYMLDTYGVFTAVRSNVSDTFFIPVEPFENPTWKSQYHAIRKDDEPKLPSKVHMYQVRPGFTMAHMGGTGFDNRILLNMAVTERSARNLDQTKWTGKDIPFPSTNTYISATALNELASVAFFATFSEFNIIWNGVKYTEIHMSELYSDIISTRKDIRDMRRILINTANGAVPGYDLTHAIIVDFLKQNGNPELREDDAVNLDLLRRMQAHLELYWKGMYGSIKNSKYRKK